MNAVKSVLAVVGALAVMAVLAFLLTVIVALPFGGLRGSATSGFWGGALAAAMISAGAGGYVATAFAPSKPFVHTLVLAVIVLALGVRSVISPQGDDPRWYTLSLAILGPIVVLAGGHVRYTRERRKFAPPSDRA